MDIYNTTLVGKLKCGDITSFEIIYKSHYKRIYHFVFQYLQDKEIASNIVQDVFSSLWDNRERLENDTNLNAWLYTVAKNSALKLLRSIKCESKHVSELSVRLININYQALSELDTSPLSFIEVERIIRTTLDSLSPQCRKAFELSRFEDKKYTEIAEQMQISQKTVETHISTALKHFRIALKDYLPLVVFLFQ